jgi:amidophosphoribosyltransferase
MTSFGQSTDRFSSKPWRDPEDDTLRLECGVFGVYGVRDAAAVTALGLHALQHRGQEACGIAAFDGQRFHTERHMGHVGDAFTGNDLVQRLPGGMAIGHTRYSTAGGSGIRNVQPMFADLETGGVAIAHNGNLTNFLTLRERLVQEGAIFQSTSDSEVILGRRGSSTASSTPSARSRAATRSWPLPTRR